VTPRDPAEAAPSARPAGPAADRVAEAAVPGAPAWCDRCGDAVADGDHAACRAARTLEPPRFCARCRRRLKVQVMPAGWRASCVEHGDIAG
jgi:hypothetical protein